MRLLVTGGRTGYLGRHVVIAAHEHEVVAAGSVDADLRDGDAVESPGRTPPPRRDRPHGLRPVRLGRHGHRCRACRDRGRTPRCPPGPRVSSDVVFSGADGLYAESARPDPITPYGAAKAAAETVALAVCPDAVVARTSLIPGDGTSQHERLVHRLVGGAEGALFDDERRTPVHVGDPATALVELAGNDVRGVLHVAGAGGDEQARAGPADRAPRRARPRPPARHEPAPLPESRGPSTYARTRARPHGS
ncbi:sugar nucleotide-binding protein [Nocardioides sp. B-3]|uniref:sugar nucleotide-binding protein n=1 Tax=Nocardioides sp. B-3 TaxID=2895565 RepID=UPI00215379C4|nr:sugar nucleotide-binding protein [Nocardioides sp. B-3]UUZ59804.1 sugar nucleotide-binding protein [Nocardioides sp. B-3]